MQFMATAPQEESRLHVSDDVICVGLKAGSRTVGSCCVDLLACIGRWKSTEQSNQYAKRTS